jgi:23S rRNA pseudouridine1911/1915/1917 synthase
MMIFETLEFTIDPTGLRLDAALAEKMPETSRAQIQEWIKQGLVKDNLTGQSLKSSFKTKDILQLRVDKPVLKPFEPPKVENRPDLLEIIFEDDYLLVINKPSGLTVHPGAGQRDGTLVNLLLGHTKGRLSDMGGGTHERPGIVHRLDKNTSGLLVVAKTNAAHVALAESLQQRTMKRIYQALVYNQPSPRDGTLSSMIGRDPNHRQRMAVVEKSGKEAVTHYTTLKTFGLDCALVECRLETGRTHQIRVHMAMINCPVIGDPLYTGRHARRKRELNPKALEAIKALPGQALHAGELHFPHPVTGELMEFKAPLPDYFANLLKAL